MLTVFEGITSQAAYDHIQNTHNLSLTLCVCVCEANFTNKHMILNVVLVNKLYLICELIGSICIISYSEAAWSSVLHLCVILGCCCNYYELRLFLCVFIVNTAAVYLCV